MALSNLKEEIATDVEEDAAVIAAEAAVVAAEATADVADDQPAVAAVVTAKANVDYAPTAAAAKKLSIVDFCMVSNDMARAILKAKGVEVKFEEPEDVKSDYYMNPIV
jgi:hypothetical protein